MAPTTVRVKAPQKTPNILFLLQIKIYLGLLLAIFVSLISTSPLPSASPDPITGVEMMTTGYMMTTAGTMMAAALLAKGISR